ncbi:MAG: hypothetical protein K2H73_07170, partial [Treponemataceae bacterium]|nr:hypothetical protein [Treponemataceae bacterium]
CVLCSVFCVLCSVFNYDGETARVKDFGGKSHIFCAITRRRSKCHRKTLKDWRGRVNDRVSAPFALCAECAILMLSQREMGELHENRID